MGNNKKNLKVDKNKNKTINWKKILLAIIVIIVLIYLVYIVSGWIKQPTNIFVVENASISLEESAIGYIIRDEIVVQGENYKNRMMQIRTEGEKVAKGEAIFRYYSEGEEEINNNIAEIDARLQEVMAENTDMVPSDIKLLEKQIKTKLEEVYDNNEIQKIKEYKRDINTQITKKMEIIGESSDNGSELKSLIQQRAVYTEQLKQNSEYIEAPRSGVISYRVDNLEEKLKIDDFSYLSKKMLEELNLKTGQIIATSEEKGKIIDNFECYIATVLDSERSKQAKVNDKVTLQLSNLEKINATIQYIYVEEDDSRLIVFKITKGIEEFIKYRKISLDVIWWEYDGLRVPNSAIITENAMNYVIRNRAGYLDKILVKVLRQNEDYSIISKFSNDDLKKMGYSEKDIINLPKISIYDEIVANPTEDMLK